ncbi:MAG: hypothetical protein ACYC8T_18920 [Myxococcaceae bacterium]
MVKLLLLSVLIALVVLGVTGARVPDARRGLGRAVLLFVGFNLAYVLALRFWYPRLIGGMP